MNKYDVVDFSEIFMYDQESPSGLRWKTQPAYHVKIGSIAGSLSNKNYWDILYKRKHYLAHRIVWILHNGKIEDDLVINHINCNPTDNRVENLEICSIMQNNQRTRLMLYGEKSIKNKTGHNGVQLLKCLNRNKTKEYFYYVGCVTVNRKLIRKLFSISKYGDQLAFEMAKNWRDMKISELQKLGYLSFNKE